MILKWEASFKKSLSNLMKLNSGLKDRHRRLIYPRTEIKCGSKKINKSLNDISLVIIVVLIVSVIHYDIVKVKLFKRSRLGSRFVAGGGGFG